MLEIKDLLERWSGILLSEEAKKEAVGKVLFEVLGVEIKSSDIKIKNNTIYLDIKPLYKNEIFLKRDKIFSKLEETFGKKAPKDIR
ncbi:MAG: hypothetical protein WAV15_02185 [Minisyncoccia bacterium]